MIKNDERNITKKKIEIINYGIPFIFAFILMMCYLWKQDSMILSSGDANDIWHTIITMDTENVYGSYVLYKGFGSVYPYYWFYKLAQFLDINDFFFVKVYHSILFGYIAAIGLPNCIELISKSKTRWWRRITLVVFLFWMWKGIAIFEQMIIDLPSCAFFVLYINAVLKLLRNRNVKWYNILWTGLLLGINLCMSGQYTLPAVIIVFYLICKTLSINIKEKNQKSIFRSIICVCVIIGCGCMVRGYNTYFEKSMVEPLREEGAWIPSGQQWIQSGLLRFMPVQRKLMGAQINDNRGLQIVEDYYGTDNQEFIDKALIGNSAITYGDYFKIVFKYPGDFVIKYCNRLFLALSPDGGFFSFHRLFIIWSLIFVALLTVWRNCRTWKSVFSDGTVVVLAFFSAVIPLMVLNVEVRCAIQIQGLVMATAITHNYFWDALNRLKVNICQRKFATEVPYIVVIYFFFMIFCFIHMGSLYDTVEGTYSILMNW